MEKTARIYIVEDDRIVSRDIRNSLEHLGYTVAGISASGEEALKELEKGQTDLVLMDILLDGRMTGIEAASVIRTRFDIPVVYLTANTDEKTLTKVKKTTPYGYIVKPFNESALQGVIETALYKFLMDQKDTARESWSSVTLRSIGDAVITADTDGKITFMNSVAENLTGWKEKQVLNQPLVTVCSILQEDTTKKGISPFEYVYQYSEIIQLSPIAVLIKRNGSQIPIAGRVAPIRDSRGKMIGLVFNFHDIDELKRTQLALQESEEKYSNLFQNSKDGIFLHDMQGKILDVNKKVLRMFGLTRKEILSMHVQDLHPGQALKQSKETFQEITKKGAVQFEIDFKKKNGEVFPAEVSSSLFEIGGKSVIQKIVHDIDERREADKRLAFERSLFRSFMDSIPNPTYFKDREGRFVEANKAQADLMGVKKKEILGKTDFDFYPKDQAEQYSENERHIIETNRVMKKEEYGTTPTGENWFFTTKAPWHDEEGKIIGTFGISWNISDRKKLEAELSESEKKYRRLFDNAIDALFVHEVTENGMPGRFIEVNHIACTQYGYTKDEFLKMSSVNIDVSEYASAVPGIMERLRRQKHVLFEMMHKTKDGREFPVEINSHLFHLKGTEVVLSISRDISERKKAEAALRESESRYRNMIELAPDGIITVDTHGVVQSCNSVLLAMTGFSREELVGKHFTSLQALSRKDVPIFIHIFNRLMTGERFGPVEFEFKNKKEATIWSEMRFAPLRQEDRIIGLQAFAHDITDRKEAREALRESEARYRAFFDRTLYGVYIHDFQGNFLDANDTALKMLGYTREEISKANIAKLLSKDQLPRAVKSIAKIRKTGRPKNPTEYKLKKRNGETIWLQTEASLIYRQGKPYAILGMAKDITDAKRTEQELKESEEKFRKLFENAIDGMIYLDSKGKILDVNNSALRIYGGEKQDLIGRHFSKLGVIPSISLSRMVQAFSRVLTGRKVNVELCIKNKKGEEIFLECSTSRIKFGLKTIGILTVARDITERRITEQAIIQSETFYRQVIENAMGIPFRLIYGSRIGEGHYEFIGSNIQKILGWSPKEFTEAIYQQSIEAAYPVFPEIPKDAGSCREAMLRQDFSSYKADVRLRTKSGQLKWMSDSSIPIKDEKTGRVIGAVGILQDITARKIAEEALIKSEMRYTLATTAGSVGVWDWDLVTDEVYIDPKLKSILGYKDYEIRNHLENWTQLILPEDTEAFMEQAQAHCNGKSDSFKLEHRMLHKEGSIQWFLTRGTAIHDRNGKPMRMVGTHSDISERKQAEKLNNAIYRISEATNTADNLDYLFHSIHTIVGELMPAQNFYIAIYEPETKTISFPYFVDEYDTKPESCRLGKGLTEYVLRTGKSLLASPEVFEQLVRKGKVESIGAPSVDWLGVPLKVKNKTIGVLTVQTYTEGVRFGEREKYILMFVSTQIALGIERMRTQDALRESEERYRSVVQVATDAVLSVDEKGMITSWNKGAKSIFGYSADEIIGKSILSVIPMKMQDSHQKAFMELTSFKRNIQKKNTIIGEGHRKDGTEFPIEVTIGVGQISKGIFFTAVIRDITERLQAEQALRESEERFRSLYENTTIGLYRTTPNGEIQMANPALIKMLGYSSFKDLASRNLDSEGFEPGYKRSEFKKIIREKGEIIGLEACWKKKDGTVINVHESAKVFKDDKGHILYYEGTVEDITEKRRVEREIEERRKYLEAVLEAAPDAIVTCDASHRIVDWNSAASRMFGYGKEEAIGRNPDDLVARTDVLAEAVGISKVALEGKDFHPLKTVRYRKDGKPVDVIVAGSPIMVGNDLIGVVGVYTDISDLKKAEIEREKMQAQLLMAQKMEAIGILAGGVAHDFNNLLTAIQGCTDMALTDMDKDSSHFQELTEARNAAGRAADLTRQLLLFSRRHPIQRVQINLNTTVENLLNMLHRLIGEDIAIRTKLEPDLWTTMADQGTIEQVIMNLAVNARDAMPKGGSITVQTQNVVLDEAYVKMRAETRKGRFICLSMEDVGIGMDSDTLEHIFEPFFTTKGPGKGTGLGLSVVYGIAKQHEGWINVYSEPNEGTTFKLYLPAMSGEANENKTLMTSLDDLKGRGERLLVVEDEKSVREFVKRALSKSGYSVFAAENAEEAVALFEKEQQKFDCIFSDVVLPDTNGIDLVDGFLKERPDMHVLLSSGYTDQKSKWPMIQERGYRFLQKPYTLIDLLSTLRELLSSTRKD